MEARLAKALVFLVVPALMGAGYQSENFVVTAPTPEIARQVGQAAEQYRKQLAIDWLGYELPRWAAPCPVKVKVGQIGAGGATTFSFFPNARGSAEVCNWNMQIQGSLERILDSVLPHEVSHTIFACHFRRPLPRWADEGAATLAEHESERRRQVLTVRQVIGTRRRIPLQNLLSITEYPSDMQDVLTLYAEGYSLAELLVQEGGRARYLKFLTDAHQGGWEKAVQVHYGYRGVAELEHRWHDWVLAGSPEINLPKDQQLADARNGQKLPAQSAIIIRGQSPAEDPFLDDPALAPGDDGTGRSTRELTAPAPRPLRKSKAKDGGAAPSLASIEDDSVPPIRKLASGDESRIRTGEAQIIPANERRTRSDSASAGRTAQHPTKGAPAARRQVTEWSEFPQDPRPSPFILPGGNRSGSRP